MTAELVAQADAHLAQLVSARGHVPAAPLPRHVCAECGARAGERCTSECMANTSGTRRA